MLYVTGPGHGGPGLVANTYLEGTYSEFYPSITEDEDEVADHGVEAGVAAREGLGIPRDEADAERGTPRPGAREHRERDVEPDDDTGPARGGRRGRDQTGPRAHVEEPLASAERAGGEDLRDERRRHPPIARS